MKLCLKQNCFSFKNPFSVTDEYGNLRYNVQTTAYGWGKELTVTLPDGSSVARVKLEYNIFTPSFRIVVEGKPEIKMKRDAWSIRQKFIIDQLGVELIGDFANHSYEAKSDQRVIFTVDKKWFSWGDCYMIDMPDGTDERLALCMVLGVDCDVEIKRKGAMTYMYLKNN